MRPREGWKGGGRRARKEPLGGNSTQKNTARANSIEIEGKNDKYKIRKEIRGTRAARASREGATLGSGFKYPASAAAFLG